jgi:hypothetical protein
MNSFGARGRPDIISGFVIKLIFCKSRLQFRSEFVCPSLFFSRDSISVSVLVLVANDSPVIRAATESRIMTAV